MRMRDYGIPKVFTWRWTPCLALVLGAFSFVGFTMLAIPERIGADATQGAPGLTLGNRFSRTQSPVDPAADFSDDDSGAQAPSPATRLASRGGEQFPKRGFTPPLDRPATPAAAPPPPPAPPAASPPAAAEPPAAPPAEPTPPAPAAAPPDAPAAAPAP